MVATMRPRRELTLHPRRAPTGLVFGLGGLFVIALGGMNAEETSSWPLVVGSLLLGLLLLLLSAHLWMTRLEARAFDDGRFTLTRREWPLRTVVIEGRLSEVSAVREVVEDGTGTLEVVIGEREVPLLASATSDSHRHAVESLRDFFELPR